jgi:hypothetical protein
MNKIEYKIEKMHNYDVYIDIGCVEKDYYALPLYDLTKSYIEWLDNFKKKPIGVQIQTINYYLLEIDNESSSPIIEKIKLNLKIFKQFNDKWFEKDTSIFRGLDFNYDEIEDQIIETKINGKEKKIKFKNGSILKYKFTEIEIKSFYILEREYNKFKDELISLIKIL